MRSDGGQFLRARKTAGVERAARIVGLVLGALVGSLSLVVVGAWIFLTTDRGADVARRWLVRKANAELAGQLSLDRLGIAGNRLTLAGLSLRDPEGGQVARIEKVDVRFSPVALLAGRIRLRDLTVDRPAVWLVQSARGLNLSRAIAARTPPKPPPAVVDDREGQRGGGGGGVALRLDRLDVSRGEAELRIEAPEQPPRVFRATGLTVTGSGRYLPGAGAPTFDVNALVQGGLGAPAPGELSLRVTASGVGFKRTARVTIAASGAQIDAGVETLARDQMTVTLDRLLIPATLVIALVPDAPIQPNAVVDAHGKLSQSGEHASVTAVIAAAGGQIAVDGKLDIAHLRTEGEAGLSVRGRRLDLSALLPSAPASDLAFDLRARGGGRDLESLTGDLNLQVPVGRVAGRPLGPVRFTVEVRPGTTTLADLVARLPGVDVTGSGHLTAGRLDLKAIVEATNLGDTTRSLAAPGRRPPIALSGRGRAELVAGGTLARPSLRIAAGFPTLAFQGNSFKGLSIRTSTPDLRRAAVSDVEVRARTANIGGRPLRQPALVVRAAGQTATATLRIAAPQPFDLTIGGRWSPPPGGAGSAPAATAAVIVEHLALRFPEGAWRLSAPARVTFGSGRWSVRNVRLDGGNQSIAVDLAHDGRSMQGHAVVARLDLARLPRALLPPRLVLSGLLNLDARLKEHAGGRPNIDVAIALSDGRIASYRNLSLAVDAHADGRRARGNLDARGLGTAVKGRFDLPMAWPPRDKRAPIELELDFAETDLALAMKAVADAGGDPATAVPPASASAPPPTPLPELRGRARLSIHIRGSLEDPHLELSAATRGLVVDRRPIGDLDLALTGEGDKPLDLTLRFAASPSGTLGSGAGAAVGAGRGTLHLRAFQSLVALLGPSLQTPSRPPSTAQLLRTRFELGAELDALPLAGVAHLAGYRPTVAGTVSLHLDLTGTPLSPRGRIAVDMANAATGRFPPTDARILLAFDERSTTGHVEIDRKRKRLLDVDAQLQSGAAGFRHPAALADVGLKVRATLNPIQMQRAGLPPQTDRDPPRVLKGLLRAALAVDGTLRAPVVDLRVDAADVRLDKVLVGEAHVVATYGAGRAHADARLFSANRGSLRIEATTRLALGYPAVLSGVDVGRLPVTLRARAQGFDIEGFSGITPGLRKLGGLIFAEAAVDGTVADPRLSGRLEWKQGVVAMTGFGEYRDLHLLLHGDQKDLVLEDLSVASGGGHAHATATAAHVPGQGYRYDARADVKRFPVYSDGQELAIVSVDVSARGTASPLKIGSVVEIKESHVALSDAKRREIQSLKRPDDVVLVQEGRPLNRAQAEKLRQAAASAQARSVAAATTAPGPRTSGRGGGAAAAQAPSLRTPAPPPPAQSPPGPAPREIHVRVDAPRNVWVTGKDAKLELGLTPPFRVTVDDRPLVFGEVQVLRGRVDVFGRRFDVKQPSTVRFNGQPDLPEVDLQAEYVNENENITVMVTAKGRLDRLQVGVSSPNRPELGESQLYTLIITGRLNLGGEGGSSATPTQQAASLMGGLVAAQLQKTLANKLPLDVLTIDAGGAGLTGTQLEAGTYLTNKLYVGYVGRVGADPMRYQNRNAVHLEYLISSRWSFDGEYGDVGTGSADLIWKKNY